MSINPESRYLSQDFRDGSKHIINEFENPEKRIKYIGSATSHFQAEPLRYDTAGNPIIVSDWEMKVIQEIEDKKEDPKTFPQFLKNKEDYIKRSTKLGENMSRISLDFPRLCPKEGEFDQKLMGEYIKTIALIKAHGQEPMLTLYHWPMPKYLLTLDSNGDIKTGGWENPDVKKHFIFYIKNVFESLSNEDNDGLVKYFISINEPASILFPGYLFGKFPPYKKYDYVGYRKALGALIEAHDIVQTELKSGKLSNKNNPQIGISHIWNQFDGLIGNLIDTMANRELMKKFERNGDCSDFLALQYYFRMSIPNIPKREKDPYSDFLDFGGIYPPGIYESLKKMHSVYPQKEIFVSEFGFSDKQDKRRPYWILETVDSILKAKQENVPIMGMLLWSLVNNYEWAAGMTQKFGLFDESDLSQPIKESQGEEVRSYEVWKAIIKVLSPAATKEDIKALDIFYQKAKKQFEVYKNFSQC